MLHIFKKHYLSPQATYIMKKRDIRSSNYFIEEIGVSLTIIHLEQMFFLA